jgi:hypothetical protein
MQVLIFASLQQHMNSLIRTHLGPNVQLSNTSCGKALALWNEKKEMFQNEFFLTVHISNYISDIDAS